ncbi:MAG: desulfoferrodoxin family protein [Lachnospirales bacterium]
MEFYYCSHCKNIIYFFNNKGVPVSCCGEKMSKLTPNTTEGAYDKHIPVIEKMNDSILVKVGSVPHPMTEEHHIAWIVLETNKGFHKIDLDFTAEPVAEFLLPKNEYPVTAYEYCNLHGLWKS